MGANKDKATKRVNLSAESDNIVFADLPIYMYFS